MSHADNTYLLDTNIVVFIAKGTPEKMSAAQLAVLRDPANSFVISAASVLEMVMLNRKGKFILPLGGRFEEKLKDLLSSLGIGVLPVSPAHSWHTSLLPIQVNHNDPMDLLILAQAFEEKLFLLSTDGKFPWYVPHGLHLIA